jgi:hypothetical protein
MIKIYTKDDIKQKISTDDKWLIAGMLSIFENNQLPDEQIEQRTTYNNGIGFNGVDSEILSSFCNFYKSKNFLSKKQLDIARKKMVKYCKQLENLCKLKLFKKMNMTQSEFETWYKRQIKVKKYEQ